MHAPLRFVLTGLLTTALATAGAAESTTHSVPAKARQFTYVIVHGAWGGGWAFREVERLLRADGQRVYRPTLTGQGEKVHLASLLTTNIDLKLHITDVANVLEWEDLHEVVLVGHSYGGMVITGVADRLPGRIKHMIYLDAILPEDGESANTVMGNGLPASTNVFIVPFWLKANTPIPHDVPHPARTFSQPITLTNQAAALSIPTTYILTVDAGKQPQQDGFYRSYERAKARGWQTEIMEGDHNVQWSKPKELAQRLEEAP